MLHDELFRNAGEEEPHDLDDQSVSIPFIVEWENSR